jgi:hypothetical protein
MYRALLARSFAPILDVTHELAHAIASEPPSYVVTDALEGYNPIHDLCRWIAGSALAMSGRHDLAHYEYSTVGRVASGGFRVELTPNIVARKLAAANRYEPLRAEVTENLERFGAGFFATETFGLVKAWDEDRLFDGGVPEYERIAAERVAAGVYRDAIRFREHLVPVRDALAGVVERVT